jgi:hypothetical protein
MDVEEIRQTVESLMEMLRQVDAGEVRATKTERAYLLGAVEALRALLAQ